MLRNPTSGVEPAAPSVAGRRSGGRQKKSEVAHMDSALSSGAKAAGSNPAGHHFWASFRESAVLASDTAPFTFPDLARLTGH